MRCAFASTSTLALACSTVRVRMRPTVRQATRINSIRPTPKAAIAQRGKATQQRHDLRLVRLATLVECWQAVSGDPAELTVTYDSGQNASGNQAHIERAGLGVTRRAVITHAEAFHQRQTRAPRRTRSVRPHAAHCPGRHTGDRAPLPSRPRPTLRPTHPHRKAREAPGLQAGEG